VECAWNIWLHIHGRCVQRKHWEECTQFVSEGVACHENRLTREYFWNDRFAG
jgi:hypothetical protein